jgi:putative colanic acid biosynthesis glycosyltransferase WcaI
VTRLPMLPRWNDPAGRLLHYLGFAAAFLGAGLVRRAPDVLLAFSSTPMFGGVSAAALARAKRCPLVYVVQDVYPEIAEAMGMLRGRLARSVARRLETTAWRSAERVVLIGDELREVAECRNVPGSRLTTIPNWADMDAIRPREVSAFRSEQGYSAGDFVVEYAGNFGRSQDLETVLEAARIVEREAAGASVRFLLVGEGSASGEVRRRARGAGNVRLAPYQPEERLPDVLAAADLSLIPLRRGLSGYCVPSKVYSILASGRPVGASVDRDSEVARLVEVGTCGFRVDPEDPEAMAAEILRLAGDRERARDLGRNGRALGERAGSLERATREYEKLLSEVAQSGRGSPKDASRPDSSGTLKREGVPVEE